jgi:acetylornithine/N-succinyldiaminopimelate aminotransferase
MKTFEQIVELERRYLLGTYSRYPVAFTRGKGVFLYDLEDRRYLDFVSGLGVNALGHAHPRIVKTIREQAAKLIHVSNLYYHEYQGELAEKLCTLASAASGGALGNARAFFQNSGTFSFTAARKPARSFRPTKVTSSSRRVAQPLNCPHKIQSGCPTLRVLCEGWARCSLQRRV